MRKITVMGVVVMALCALGAVFASVALATAPDWKVNGAFFAGSKFFSGVGTSPLVELQVLEAKMPGPLTLATAGKECKISGSIKSPIAAELEGEAKEVKLSCTGVKVKANAECVVEGPPGEEKNPGKVVTNLAEGDLGWAKATGLAAVQRLAPIAGKEQQFVLIKITKCALAGMYAMKGMTMGSFTPVATEVVAGTLTFPEEPILKYFDNGAKERKLLTTGGLTFGPKEASLVGAFSMELIGEEAGKKFGIFDH